MTRRSTDPTPHRAARALVSRLAPLALLVIASLGGCAKGTYLEINFTGPALLPPVRVQVDLTLTGPGGSPVTTSHDLVPAATEAPVRLPASMALKLDDDSGTLHIGATAIDANQKTVGTAMADTTVMHGETWTVNVPFQVLIADQPSE